MEHHNGMYSRPVGAAMVQSIDGSVHQSLCVVQITLFYFTDSSTARFI